MVCDYAAHFFTRKIRTNMVLIFLVAVRATVLVTSSVSVMVALRMGAIGEARADDGSLSLLGQDTTYIVNGAKSFLTPGARCSSAFIASPFCVDGGATIKVVGADADLVTQKQIFIGYKAAGTSTLSVEDGGRMVANNSILQAGWSGGNGVVNVSGAGSTLWALTGGTLIAGTGDNGNAGSPLHNTDQKTTGAINVTDGGAIFADTVASGLYGDGVGSVTVNGKNSLLYVGGDYYVNGGSGGSGGNGVTRISNNGRLVVYGQIYFGGDRTDGIGRLILQSGGTLELGDTVSNGKTVSALLDQEGTGGRSEFILDGGIIKLVNSGLNTAMNMQLGAGTQSTVDTNGKNASFSGILSGAGGLTKAGTGTLELSGVNSYSGVTDIQSGTLKLSGSGSINQTEGIHNNGQLDIADVAAGTVLVRSMDGSGSVVLGNKTLNMTDGNSTFGNVLSGSIVGSGHVSISGGTTVLTGESTYTGGTDVQAGVLQVEGSLLSPVSVQAGAALVGQGSVGSTVIYSGGGLLPGGTTTTGTLHITGNLAMETGSVLHLNGVSAAQEQVAVTGQATLSGGTVQLPAFQGLRYGVQYPLLFAAGGVSGHYDGLNANSADNHLFLTPGLFYGPDTVSVQLLRNDVSFASVGQTRNQQAAGYGVQALAATNPVAQTMVQMEDVRAVRSALDALSGEIHASARTVLLQDAFYVRQAVSDRLAGAGCEEWASDNGLHTVQVRHGHMVEAEGCRNDHAVLWGEAYGGLGRNNGDGNAASLHNSTAGFIMGADTALGAGSVWRAGGLVSYGRTMVNDGGRSSSGHSNNLTLGGYAGAHWGRLNLRMGASYTWNMLALSRTVAFAGFRNTLSSHYNGGTAQGFGELGYQFHLRRTVLEPFGNVAYVNQRTGRFREQGGAAALRGRAIDTGVTFATFGLRASSTFHAYGVQLTPHGTLGYRHAFGLTTASTHEAFAASSVGGGMDVAGVSLSRDAATIDAGLSAKLTDRVDISLSYLGQYGRQSVSSGAHGRVTFRF